MRIGIIGGGASGILLLNELISKGNHQINEIHIFDKENFQGGLAYKTKSAQHLLNMHASKMSGKYDDHTNFIKWVDWVEHLDFSDGYVPRKLYHKYLYEMFNSILLNHKTKVHHQYDEVVDITTSGQFHTIRTNNSSVTVDYCILCTGHGAPEDIYRLQKHENYFNDPYIVQNIKFNHGNVGLIGTGLTSIDKSLELCELHNDIQIKCFSRSGAFPNIQTNYIDESLKLFRHKILDYVNSKKNIEADDLIEQIELGIRYHCGDNIKFTLRQTDNGALELEKNIRNAISNQINSYSYLAGISDLMCDAWSKMNLTQKWLFDKKYLSEWMRLRHAMPLRNGVKILKLINENKLSLHPLIADENPIHVRDKFEINIINSNKIHCDYLFNCTGAANVFDDNKLFDKLLESGLLSKHEHSGVNCDYKTNKIIDASGKTRDNFFIVGAATRGVFFYVSGIDHIINRTKVVAKYICEGAN